VLPYVRYTKRLPIVQPFSPEEGEDRLYHSVSEYLRRDNLQALPASQRSLMTLVLRKLLASSTFAIAGALETLSRRLRARLQQAKEAQDLEEELNEDFEAFDEMAEEWGEEDTAPELLSPGERTALAREIEDLESFRALAVSITHNAKGAALLTALQTAFAKAEGLGAARKAIVFTESRRTQDYLLRVLADSPYEDSVVLFNGSNNDEKSREIYADWLGQHTDTERVTGSRSADMRSALVDYFRDQGQIMIATEAGAEGINLQFCSLVVNYDLPWNPQRIEQRIGRCHRYGQEHDVVVVNFLNKKNAADQRVFQLLSEKFSLFEGVFGASDEVLGAIESGVDFEKRIADIYQRCRTPEEINASFDRLQQELSQQIDEAMTRTRQQLFENFDAEVIEKLRISRDSSTAYLDHYERMLMELTHHELRDHIKVLDGVSSFQLTSCPFVDDIPIGLYELPRRSGEAYLYRLAHPLAQHVLAQAKDRALSPAEMIFDYTNHLPTISVLKPLVGQEGSLRLSLLTIESLDQIEDYLIIAALADNGQPLDVEQSSRLLRLPAWDWHTVNAPPASEPLASITMCRQDAILQSISQRNAVFFEVEVNKLDGWAEDLKVGLEREIKELDRQIREARRTATATPTLQEKIEAQKHVKSLEAHRNTRRRVLFDAQDDIDRHREQLIAEIEGTLGQKTTLLELFSIR
jgi:helicase-like protein